jgi:hypothetical protein
MKMQVYVIGSPQIQIAKPRRQVLSNHRALSECKYEPQQMLDHFQRDQTMKVFSSLENAELYMEATRRDVRESPWAILEMHAYPIYRVELSDDISLTTYQTNQEKSTFTFDSRFQNKLAKDEQNQYYLLPSYHEVPANLVTRVLSVVDFYDVNKETDLLNLHSENRSKNCCVVS